MKIGVLGLGNIFQKAYLPTLGENRQAHSYYFASKNEETKKLLKSNYGFTNFAETLDELLEEGIEACMIHSATVAHYELAKKCLNAGVHVLMDKPLSEEYEETKELIELAEEKGLTLMIGFNRRFAPAVNQLKVLPNKRVIYLEKNRTFAEYDTKFSVYDLFLHLVDTAVYLLDSSDIKIVSSHIEETKILEYVTVTLQAGQTTAILTMDMKSGANTEMYRVTSDEGIMTVSNLSEISHQKGTEITKKLVSDWEKTLVTRGFEPMLKAFLEHLEGHKKIDLRQENVLRSHEVCLEILN